MYEEKKLKCFFKGQSIDKSFLCAMRGIWYLFLCHKNMRTIFLLGILVFLSGLYFNLKGIELVALCITVTMVFMAEIINTSVEMLMDIISEEYNLKIKLLKDISAGIVLIACLNALAIGYIFFIRKFFI